MARLELILGQTVWYYDTNRRRYPPRPAGQGYWASPIWREHWRAETVVGETVRSWVTSGGTKLPKHGRDVHGWAFSEAELDRREWLHENRRLLMRRLEALSGEGHGAYDLFQAVEELLDGEGNQS